MWNRRPRLGECHKHGTSARSPPWAGAASAIDHNPVSSARAWRGEMQPDAYSARRDRVSVRAALPAHSVADKKFRMLPEGRRQNNRVGNCGRAHCSPARFLAASRQRKPVDYLQVNPLCLIPSNHNHSRCEVKGSVQRRAHRDSRYFAVDFDPGRCRTGSNRLLRRDGALFHKRRTLRRLGHTCTFCPR
jgi:hypothetical protein